MKNKFFPTTGTSIKRLFIGIMIYITLRKNIRKPDYSFGKICDFFPNAIHSGHFNNFRYNRKNIEYITVPSTIGQAKLLPQLTESLATENPRNTAIILCDEQLLIPVMHSIPEYIQKINITMGYPANHTAVAAFITLLCDLRNFAKQEKNETYYYYKPVIALLNHKFIKNLCPDDIYQITNYIHQKNIVYITEKACNFTR